MWEKESSVEGGNLALINDYRRLKTLTNPHVWTHRDYMVRVEKAKGHQLMTVL